MYNLYMKTKLTKWGNSIAIRIPKVFALQIGMESDKEVEIQLKDNAIVISSTLPSLNDLLKHVTPDNLHEETETGSVTGKEIW